MQGKCIIVMGVSGSGKSTIAAAIAQKMNAKFIEGDDLHSQQNIEKMKHDIPLTDDDRKDWLEKIHTTILQIVNEEKDCVVSCSALKVKYRAVLRNKIENILFIYLKGSFELIHSWLEKRTNHFMPVDLLKSQFADLQEPNEDEKDVITMNLIPNIEEEIAQIENVLKERKIILQI